MPRPEAVAHPTSIEPSSLREPASAHHGARLFSLPERWSEMPLEQLAAFLSTSERDTSCSKATGDLSPAETSPITEDPRPTHDAAKAEGRPACRNARVPPTTRTERPCFSGAHPWDPHGLYHGRGRPTARPLQNRCKGPCSIDVSRRLTRPASRVAAHLALSEEERNEALGSSHRSTGRALSLNQRSWATRQQQMGPTRDSLGAKKSYPLLAQDTTVAPPRRPLRCASSCGYEHACCQVRSRSVAANAQGRKACARQSVVEAHTGGNLFAGDSAEVLAIRDSLASGAPGMHQK